MNLSVKSLIGQKIFSEKKTLGKVAELIFSPETGRLFSIKTQSGIFFSADNLIFEDEKVRLISEIANEKLGENWLGYRVVSENRNSDFGEITDIEFDSNLFVIHRIMVTKSVFGLPLSRHIFPYDRIIDVREKTVFINTDTKEWKREMVPAI